jgi:hypothetical protein
VSLEHAVLFIEHAHLQDRGEFQCPDNDIPEIQSSVNNEIEDVGILDWGGFLKFLNIEKHDYGFHEVVRKAF